MRRVIYLIVILALAACTTPPEATEPEFNTDLIAGYWSGKVTGELDSGEELPTRDIQIIIIPGCTIGKVCGKLSEDGQCPGEIILRKGAGNRYGFLSETVSGAQEPCGGSSIRLIDLELRSDGQIYIEYHNGVMLTGLLLGK